MKVKLSSLSNDLRSQVKPYIKEGKLNLSSIPKSLKESLVREMKSEHPMVSYLKMDHVDTYGWTKKEVTFKRGSRCLRADNQPDDENRNPYYWIDDVPAGLEDDDEFMSWKDIYGFKVPFEMVTPFSMKLMESEEGFENLFDWCSKHGLELAGHAIAYYMFGDRSDDNPFHMGFWTLRMTSIRDDKNPVPLWWNEFLFEYESEISSSMDGYNIIDVEYFDNNLLDQFAELESKSFSFMEGDMNEVYVYKNPPKGSSDYPEVPMDSNPVEEAAKILSVIVRSFNADVNKAREAIFDVKSGGIGTFKALHPEEKKEVFKIMKVYGLLYPDEKFSLNENEHKLYVVYDYTANSNYSEAPEIHGVYSDINLAKKESKKIRLAQGKMPKDKDYIPTDMAAKVMVASKLTIEKAKMMGRFYA